MPVHMSVHMSIHMLYTGESLNVSQKIQAVLSEQESEEELYRREVYELVNRMRTELAIKDRKIAMKSYRKTFVGTEAVEWICQHAPISTLQAHSLVHPSYLL